MNMLLQDLPTKINVDGVIHDIDFDYQSCLQIIIAWEDDQLLDNEKVMITLNNLYHVMPANLEVALQKAIDFLNCGNETEEKHTKKQRRLYSFEKDSKYIFSAVDRATEGKLSSGVKLHWWLFNMAFMEVSEASFFSRMIQLRTAKRKGKLTKEERQYWKDNREILEIDISQDQIATPEEIANMKHYEEIMKRKEEAKKTTQ